MPDIEKLKQEAEEARDATVKALSGAVPCWMAEKIADALIRATALHLKVQAAEKEAEAQKSNPFLQKALKIIDELTPEKIESSMTNFGIEFEKRVNPDPAPIADDGWVKWEGGECPVDEDTKVIAKMRSGRMTKTWSAGALRWRHEDDTDDIIAYHIVTPAADRVEES